MTKLPNTFFKSFLTCFVFIVYIKDLNTHTHVCSIRAFSWCLAPEGGALIFSCEKKVSELAL